MTDSILCRPRWQIAWIWIPPHYYERPLLESFQRGCCGRVCWAGRTLFLELCTSCHALHMHPLSQTLLHPHVTATCCVQHSPCSAGGAPLFVHNSLVFLRLLICTCRAIGAPIKSTRRWRVSDRRILRIGLYVDSLRPVLKNSDIRLLTDPKPALLQPWTIVAHHHRHRKPIVSTIDSARSDIYAIVLSRSKCTSVGDGPGPSSNGKLHGGR